MSTDSPTPAEILRAGTEKFNAHDLSGLEMIADRVLDQGAPTTRDDWRRKWEALWAVTPDMRATVEHVVAGGEWVARRLTTRGTGPDGPFETWGLDMVRIVDGKIVEHWATVARPE